MGGRAYPGSRPPGAERSEVTLGLVVSGSAPVLTGRPTRHTITASLRGRLDPLDDARSLIDLSDLWWSVSGESAELTAGTRIVRWSVAESAPLVDVINQEEFGQDAHTPQRLGQPLLHLRVLWRSGALELLGLAWPRERRFSGRGARLWSSVPVDQGAAVFERRAADGWAARWTQTLGGADLGVAHVSATTRQPVFVRALDDQGSGEVRVPSYPEMEQTSLDLEWVTGPWIVRAEALRRALEGGRAFYAAIVGVERAVTAYLSAFVEYAHDDRGADATTSYEHDVFVGGRLLTQDWTVTGRAFVDARSANVIASATAARRIGARTVLELDGRLFAGDEDAEPDFAHRRDGYVAVRLLYFF